MPRDLWGYLKDDANMLTRSVVYSLLMAAAAAPALAALGGDVTSVEADRVRMKGALQTTYSAN